MQCVSLWAQEQQAMSMIMNKAVAIIVCDARNKVYLRTNAISPSSPCELAMKIISAIYLEKKLDYNDTKQQAR